MTTTLRPAGAEWRGPGGARSREFAVCVNGRPVGGVRLAAEGGGGPGRIEALAVDEPDRGRGRGTVAALAAEEVLRQWGCRLVVVSVPEEAAYGLRTALSLGYTETARTLHKDLAAGSPAPPAPGVRVSERPLAGAGEWLDRVRAGFVAALTATGVPVERAEAHARASYEAALSRGTLLALDAGGATVGRIWFTATPPSGRVQAVRVGPAHRGRGFGRALVHAAESRCREAGVTGLGVHVFTADAAALGLYGSLGYGVRTRQLGKSLL